MHREHSLDRVIETLSQQFPRLRVADCVHTTHARLRQQATVTEHLAALTQREARDALARRAPLPGA